jgi:hypothetical protein
MTIRHHFTWNNLQKTVHDVCSRCDTCQRCKKTSQKYGHLPEKEAEAVPCEKLCVDLIGPYTMRPKSMPKGKSLTLWCLTMIDPATGWFEIVEIKNKEAIHIANLVEQTWLTRYPWPQEITFDRGTEFMAEFSQMVQKDYGIKPKPASVRNPQVNSILERIHQTLGNIIRTFEVHESYLDENDPWKGLLAAAMFALRATVHTTTKATPAQLVFGRDAIMNVQFQADWNAIKEFKQKQIRLNNQRENDKRIAHEYHAGDRVLYRSAEVKGKFLKSPWEGPYIIKKVNDNGTVRLKMGAVTDTVNIRLIKPYKT